MSKGWERIKKEELTVALDECPFCHTGETTFLKSDQHHMLQIIHWPLRGVNCPARMEQYCDSQEQGASWWNDRTPKQDIVEAEKERGKADEDSNADGGNPAGDAVLR